MHEGTGMVPHELPFVKSVRLMAYISVFEGLRLVLATYMKSQVPLRFR